MDVKLKNFSSGMQVRLAFSIAIRAESDILLIDEVLAVGDAAFQQKCYEYFARIKRSNKTVILVTHDMSTVERFCTRALIIDKGTNSGEVMSVARAVKLYNEVNQEESASSDIESEQVSHETRQKRVVSVRSVRLLNSDQSEKKSFEQGESMTIEIALQHHSNAVMSAGVVVGLAFHDTDNVNLAGPNSIGHNFSGTEKLIKYKIPKLPFNTGKYSLTVALFDGYLSERYDLIDKNIHFTVIAGTTTYGKFVIDADWSNK